MTIGARIEAVVKLFRLPDVVVGESVSLPENRAFHFGGDGRFSVLRERVRRVMHDASVIVARSVTFNVELSVKIMFLAILDVVPVDINERVAIGSTLLVKESKGMHNLVDCRAETACAVKLDGLLSAIASDR